MTKKNTSIGKAHEVRLMPKAKWGVHYHAIHPWTLEYHPQGAQTRAELLPCLRRLLRPYALLGR